MKHDKTDYLLTIGQRQEEAGRGKRVNGWMERWEGLSITFFLCAYT